MPESKETGALTEAVYYILLSLYTPMHGYKIMQNVTAFSEGRVSLGPGTLYGALNTLLEKNWICMYENAELQTTSRKKEYIITDLGKSVLIGEVERLKELFENGMKVMGGAS